MGSHSSRALHRVAEPPEVAPDFGQPGTPQYEVLNRYRAGSGPDARDDLLAVSNRLVELKARFGHHAKHYSPWQHLGDRTQEVWHHVASPLSLHAAVVPPPYTELIKIENQLAHLFRDPNRFAAEKTQTQRALDEMERAFQNYETDSKHGRALVRTAAKLGAMLPAAPFVIGGGPLVGAGAAAVATAATHIAIENEEAALEGTVLAWPQLVAEAAKAGGSAFLEVFVLTKFSPYLMAIFPRAIGARISDPQLALLGKRLGRTVSRVQLIEALSKFSAELWGNILSSGSATCFELTFDLLRSNVAMTLGEFASSLVTNMLTAGGLQILAGALIHAKTRWIPTSGTTRTVSRDELQGHGQPQVVPHPHPHVDPHLRAGETAASERNAKRPDAPSLEDIADPLRAPCGSATSPGAAPAHGGAGRTQTAGSPAEQGVEKVGCSETVAKGLAGHATDPSTL